MTEYIAHIRETDGSVQSIAEHSKNVAALTSLFAGVFEAGDLGYRCGLLHDLGKFSSEFQQRIHGARLRVDHSTAGARESMQLGDPCSAFCIAGHHGGLPDGGNQKWDAADSSTLVGRLKRNLPDCSAGKNELTIPAATAPAFSQDSPFAAAFFIRMLYSCLVDADYLDTESFMAGQKIVAEHDIDPVALLTRLQTYIAPWWDAKTALNQRRCAILRCCLERGEQNTPGLFSLTVPTGGGKTIASLAFALSQAVRWGKKRIIYIIPYTSIIEQTVDVFSKALGAENILAHYAQAAYDTEETDWSEAELRKNRAADNWDAPVIVTTAVQFFESLFANKPSKCRKLHRIANSVLIFDEAQMLPIAYLHPCVAAMAELVKHYRCTTVLCTATQPALDDLFREYAPELSVREICPDAREQYAFFRRNRIVNIGRLADDELAGRLNALDQALCIVNSRQQAADLFALLGGDEGNYHLSTLMTPLHRRQVIAEIKKRLSVGLPCRVISTSLIEAGVDLDFPTVYRAEAGLDSLLQAAGRCNREALRPADDCMVYSFIAQQAAPRLLEQNIAAAGQVMRDYSDCAQPDAIRAYFNYLHKLKGAALDAKDIMGLWAQGWQGGILPFRHVASVFRLIEDRSRTVYIPQDQKSEEYSARLRCGERSRQLYRLLGQYGASVYTRQFQALYDAGIIELIDEDAVLIDPRAYDAHLGLSLLAESGQAIIV